MTAKSKRKKETHNNSDHLFFFLFFIFFSPPLFLSNNKQEAATNTIQLLQLKNKYIQLRNLTIWFTVFFACFILLFELAWKGRELRHDAIERGRSQEENETKVCPQHHPMTSFGDLYTIFENWTICTFTIHKQPILFVQSSKNILFRWLMQYCRTPMRQNVKLPRTCAVKCEMISLHYLQHKLLLLCQNVVENVCSIKISGWFSTKSWMKIQYKKIMSRFRVWEKFIVHQLSKKMKKKKKPNKFWLKTI